MQVSTNDLDRFDAKFFVGKDGCWHWTASKNVGGYGIFRFEGHNQVAHRVSYRMFVGPIPEGLELDHLCRNRGCVNPDHLEPVTRIENQIRGNANWVINARKTHCKWGHPFDDDNTYQRRSGDGFRQCKQCIYDRKYGNTHQRQEVISGKI